MVKLTVLYKHPEDPATFNEVYFKQHIPLAQKMPDLHKIEVNRVTGAPRGEPEYYLMAHLYYDDAETMQRSLASEESRAANRSLRDLGVAAPTMLLAEVEEL